MVCPVAFPDAYEKRVLWGGGASGVVAAAKRLQSQEFPDLIFSDKSAIACFMLFGWL